MSTAVSPCLFLAKHMSDGEINKVGAGWLAGWLWSRLGWLPCVWLVQFVFSLPQVSLFMQKVIEHASCRSCFSVCFSDAPTSTAAASIAKMKSSALSSGALVPAASPLGIATWIKSKALDIFTKKK